MLLAPQCPREVLYTVEGVEMEQDKNKIKLIHCIPNITSLISVLLLKPNREFSGQLSAALCHSDETSISASKNNVYTAWIEK